MAIEREINYKFSATENVTSVAGRVHKALKSARKSEGAEALEEIAKLGRGAGTLVGFELTAKAIEKVTDTMKELRAESLKMPMTAADTAEAWAKTIPVYGQIIAAGRKLRAELDGTTKYVEKLERRTAGQDIIGENTRKTADLKDVYHAYDFRARGQDLKANLLDIKADREKQVGELRKQIEEEQKTVTNPGQRAKLREQHAEQSHVIDRMTAAKNLAAIEADRVAKNERLFSLADKGVEFLQKEAELEKGGAALEAGKLEIVNQYAKKREELANLLKKDNLTQEENNLLHKTQALLPQQEKEALRKFGIATPKFSGGTAPTDESYFSTGVAAAARENDPANRIAKTSEEIAKYAKLTYEVISKQNPTPYSLTAK